MKKLITLFALAVTVLTANAQLYYATNNLAAGSHTVRIGTPIDTIQITAWNTNQAPTLVYLFNGYLVNTNAAYTNYTGARTAVITTQINSTGSTNLYTNYVWKTTANPVAAAEVAATPIASFVVGGTNAISVVDIPLSFTRHLTVSNSQAGLNFLLEYRLR